MDKYPPILVIDDTPHIHQDFIKAICNEDKDSTSAESLDDLKTVLFGNAPPKKPRQKLQIHSAYKGEEGVELVKHACEQGNPYAIAFIDLRLSGPLDGMSVAKKILAVDDHIYVVLCTAYTNYSFPELCHCLEHPSRWFVLKKPFDLIEICQFAYGLSEKWILEKKEKQKLAHLQETLLFQNTHDALTQLPNRSTLLTKLEQEIKYATLHKQQLGLCILDIDNFKQINALLGYQGGDELLQSVAQRILVHLGKTDSVFRLGGDEFILVLSRHKTEKKLTEKARQVIEWFEPSFIINTVEVNVSPSLGIAIFPKHSEDPETLIKYADLALLRAKELGRNNVQLYDPSFSLSVEKRQQLTRELRHAVKNQELHLYYQPLVDLTSEKIIGVEALLRWKHKSFGFVMPSSFIPLAEQAGLMNTIGEWVMRVAFRQVSQWQAILPELCLSINISKSQFHQNNFVDLLLDILQETQLSPKNLELDFTQGIMTKNPEELAGKMMLLKEKGIRLAIDDFGIGSANINCIKHLPFDRIKIDKSFVDGIVSKPTDRKIIQAIISITQSFGLSVLAEGVENQTQVEFLRQNHSSHVQGFYYSPPVDAESFTQLLLTHSKK